MNLPLIPQTLNLAWEALPKRSQLSLVLMVGRSQLLQPPGRTVPQPLHLWQPRARDSQHMEAKAREFWRVAGEEDSLPSQCSSQPPSCT